MATDLNPMVLYYDHGTGWVTVGFLAAGSVNTAALADGAVTAIKLATDAVTPVKIQAAAVTTVKVADSNVTFAKLEAALKPSQGAAGAAEALRALGTAAGTALAGNAAAAQVPVAVYSAVRGNGQTYTITAPVAGTYALEFGAAFYNESGQGDSATIGNNKDSVLLRYHTVGGGAGPALTIVTLGAGEVVTLTVASGGSLSHCWAKLTRIA